MHACTYKKLGYTRSVVNRGVGERTKHINTEDCKWSHKKDAYVLERNGIMEWGKKNANNRQSRAIHKKKTKYIKVKTAVKTWET